MKCTITVIVPCSTQMQEEAMTECERVAVVVVSGGGGRVLGTSLAHEGF